MREITDFKDIISDINKVDYVEYDKLYCSMSIPSAINVDSIGMEYIQKWFFSKIQRDFFKNIYINNKHVLDDFRNQGQSFKIDKSIKPQKPMLSIKNDLHLDYNRDNLDLYLYGINNFTRKGMFNKKFFNDIPNNNYISLCLEGFEIAYTFTLKLATRAQQIDLYKYMQMAYRVGATQGDYIDMDVHVPYTLMLNVAKNAGFEIKDDKIVRVLDFLNYLNKHSLYTFLYKYRALNGKDEFYIRIPDQYMHISNLDAISIDDGEKEGMLYTNYGIEMTVTLQMPSVKMYLLYSKRMVKPEYPADTTSDYIAGLYSITIPTIPELNSKGWGTYLTTDYEEQDTSKPLEIDFKELFTGSPVEKILEYNNKMLISSSTFIEFKIYNDGKELEFDIDWNNYIIKCKNKINNIRSTIVVYIDLEYVNNVLQIITNVKDRFSKSDN